MSGGGPTTRPNNFRQCTSIFRRSFVNFAVPNCKTNRRCNHSILQSVVNIVLPLAWSLTGAQVAIKKKNLCAGMPVGSGRHPVYGAGCETTRLLHNHLNIKMKKWLKYCCHKLVAWTVIIPMANSNTIFFAAGATGERHGRNAQPCWTPPLIVKGLLLPCSPFTSRPIHTR